MAVVALAFSDLSFAAWLRLIIGVAAWLVPGVLWSARLLPSRPAWLLAPVLSASTVGLTGLAASWGFGVPLTAATTVLWAGLWSATALLRPLHAPDDGARRRWHLAWPTPSWRAPWLMLAVMVLVGLVHAGPHLHGDDTIPGVFGAWADGGHDGRIRHVDEMVHVTNAAAMAREQTAFPANPFTGDGQSTRLHPLTLHERGFQVGLAQLLAVGGVPLPALAAWGPMVVAALLAGLVYQLPGRLPALSAAAVALVPTTLAFLGPGYLVPIGVGLLWPVTVALLHGRPRAAAVVAAAGFGIHVLIGAACLVVWAAGQSWRRPRPSRLVPAVAAGAILLWAVADRIPGLIAQQADHDWDRGVFLVGGAIVPALGIFGAAAVAWRGGPARRGLAVLAIGATAAVGWSLATGHNGLVLYYRATPLLFVAAGCHVGSAVARAGDELARWRGQAAQRTGTVGLSVLLVIAVLGASGHHAGVPSYEVFAGDEWDQAATFVAAAEPGERFLAHPFASLLLAYGGATPNTFLIPGYGPNNFDHEYYAKTQGADEARLRARGIDWVVAPWPPNAPHESVAPGVYQLSTNE